MESGTKNSSMVQYEIKVTGRVQGVGFRYYALQKAKEFYLEKIENKTSKEAN